MEKIFIAPLPDDVVDERYFATSQDLWSDMKESLVAKHQDTINNLERHFKDDA